MTLISSKLLWFVIVYIITLITVIYSLSKALFDESKTKGIDVVKGYMNTFNPKFIIGLLIIICITPILNTSVLVYSIFNKLLNKKQR